MTQVERLARELFTAAYPSQTLDMHADLLKEGWLRLARHVLRRERAVRGRTLGYCKAPSFNPEGFAWTTVSRAQYLPDDCRVVAVPKRKKGAK